MFAFNLFFVNKHDMVAVIDCGFVKVRAYNPNNGLGELQISSFGVVAYWCLCTESLVVTPVSQSSATQRSGRAGRVRSGETFRADRRT